MSFPVSNWWCQASALLNVRARFSKIDHKNTDQKCGGCGAEPLVRYSPSHDKIKIVNNYFIIYCAEKNVLTSLNSKLWISKVNRSIEHFYLLFLKPPQYLITYVRGTYLSAVCIESQNWPTARYPIKLQFAYKLLWPNNFYINKFLFLTLFLQILQYYIPQWMEKGQSRNKW